nr:uncharacterized protein LOC128695979 [Cherax quadricarinatus]
MNFQVLACVLGTVGLAAAVPVPSTPQQVPSVNDNALDSEVLSEVAALTSKFLPALREAFNNEEGTRWVGSTESVNPSSHWLEPLLSTEVILRITTTLTPAKSSRRLRKP